MQYTVYTRTIAIINTSAWQYNIISYIYIYYFDIAANQPPSVLSNMENIFISEFKCIFNLIIKLLNVSFNKYLFNDNNIL